MSDNCTKTRLPYTELNVGGKVYLLRLTALSAVRLEERLGMSVYDAVERTGEVRIVSELIYALIEGLRPEFTKQDAYSLIDDYISEGGTLISLNGIIAKALGVSGFFGEASAPQESL